jgi:hypothetical protein
VDWRDAGAVGAATRRRAADTVQTNPEAEPVPATVPGRQGSGSGASRRTAERAKVRMQPISADGIAVHDKSA